MAFPEKEVLKRQEYIDFLAKGISAKKNIAILGKKKTGKTTILNRIRDENTIYIDMDRISMSPENFSFEFTSAIVKQILNIGDADQSIEHLIEISGKLSPEAVKTAKDIENELQKIKPDQKMLVTLATGFGKAIATIQKKKFTLLLDNFENIFSLNNYQEIKDILSFFDFSSKDVMYVLTSSHINFMESQLKGKGFEIRNIDYLTRDETGELMRNYFDAAEKDIDDVFKFSHGHPYIIECICKAYNDKKNLKKAIAFEFLSKDSRLNNFFQLWYNDSLNRARGKTLLSIILKVLSTERALRLNEISRRIYRSAPVTKQLLERLMQVDIIRKENHNFMFSDQSIRLWFVANEQDLDIESYDKLEEEL